MENGNDDWVDDDSTENVEFDAIENRQFLKGKKILLVEDSRTQGKYYRQMLKDLSAEVHVVETGEDALEYIRDKEHHCNAIIMDYFMPGMNGKESASAIRKTGYKSPIIGMTANYDEVNKYEWFVSGCDAILKKPITAEQFIKHLSYSFALSSENDSSLQFEI